jgi:DNA-binding FadR family transcriptional regulator
MRGRRDEHVVDVAGTHEPFPAAEDGEGDEGRDDEAREFHLAIFNAIQSGQHKLAHQQMRNHLDRSKYRLLDASQEVTAAKSKPNPKKVSR